MAQSNVRIELGLDIEGLAATTSLLNGTVDPSAGGGLAAEVGSIYMRNTAGVDGGEAYLKFGDDDVDWILFANSGGGAPSGEDTFQNNFMGKTGLGNEYPEYTSTNVVTADSTGSAGDGDNLEEAISALDAAMGADSDLTPVTRTVGQLVASESAKQNIEDLDTVVGADADMTSTNVISTASNIYTNLAALDAATGPDSALTPLTRTVGQLVASESAKANIEDLDTVIGADADMTSTDIISTANNIYTNLSSLDSAVSALQSGLQWLEECLVITADDLSSRTGTGDNTFSDNNGTAPTLAVGDRIASTFDNTIYIVQAGAWTTAAALTTDDTFFVENNYLDPVNQERGAAFRYDGSALIKVADFDFELADSINLTGGYTPANGTVAASDTIEVAIQKLDANQADLITLSGVAQGAVDLGTFTGDIISDNVTIKTALQELETASGSTTQLTPLTRTVGQLVASESNKQNIEDLDTVVGADADMVSTTYISTANNIYANLSALDAAIGAGNQASADSVTGTAVTLDSVVVDDIGAVEWLVFAEDETNQKRNAVKVYACHDGISTADATEVDYSNHIIQRAGGTISGLSISVDLDGTGGSQTMRLRVSCSSVTVNFRARRHDVEI
jgi:chaperonin cofactor prefoldin